MAGQLNGVPGKHLVVTLILLMGLAALPVRAQSDSQGAAKADKESRGITAFTGIDASTNALGQVYKWNTSVGYNWNQYLGFDVGLPAYSVHPSSSTGTTSLRSGTGLGNVYADMRLTFLNPVVNYVSTVTGAAPTGDKDRGLSTGRATFDWNNHFDRTIPLIRLTPFVNAGIASTVSDTVFFTRPFTSLGMVGHFEGGGQLHVAPFVHLGASVYDIEPTGTQKVFSRLVTPQGMFIAQSRRHGGGVFEQQQEAVGGADLTRDNGASAWLGAGLGRLAELELGYSRSVHYDLNTFSLSISFNLGSIVRKARGQ